VLKHFKNYRIVYKFLFQTFFKSWRVRFSYLLRFIVQVSKIVAFPVATSWLIELLGRNGTYAKLWHRQQRGLETD